ncbi:hypothetical protein BUMB_04132 [Candidatus Paraburkholderia calva]|nr:hypothetical protein BUMB_04132 [Candidatus Paraburkholderia calva]
MAQVIPIETAKRVRRARQLSEARGRVAPVLAGAGHFISRLSLYIAWLFFSAVIRIFGRYMRFPLTWAFLVALAALGVKFFHRWPSLRHAIIATIAAIASLGLREMLFG